MQSSRVELSYRPYIMLQQSGSIENYTVYDVYIYIFIHIAHLLSEVRFHPNRHHSALAGHKNAEYSSNFSWYALSIYGLSLVLYLSFFLQYAAPHFTLEDTHHPEMTASSPPPSRRYLPTPSPLLRIPPQARKDGPGRKGRHLLLLVYVCTEYTHGITSGLVWLVIRRRCTRIVQAKGSASRKKYSMSISISYDLNDPPHLSGRKRL